MPIQAVVPLKALAAGKSRLAGVLAEPQRERLIRTMLEGVVAAAIRVPALARVSVLTADPALVPRGAGHLPDEGEELNDALSRAAHRLRASGPETAAPDVLLILAADLPFVTAEEIASLAEASRWGGAVAAADWKEAGTNALAMPLAAGMATRFGSGSLAAHEAAARAAHLGWTVLRLPGLAYDLDEPAQLASVARRGGVRYAFLRTR
ncbi:MAG: 2-phospho-L-lactate guanylyltransferase [Steroidobacteraceae bacterium]